MPNPENNQPASLDFMHHAEQAKERALASISQPGTVILPGAEGVSVFPGLSGRIGEQARIAFEHDVKRLRALGQEDEDAEA